MTLAKLISRLFARGVRQPNGCLVVQCKKRYLDVIYDGKKSRAHRAVWEFYNGRAVPIGLEVMHSCDTTRCIEPAHLSCGTHKQNMEDRDRKWRGGTYGERSPLAKLTAEKVLAIYHLTQTERCLGDIALEFSVSIMTVKRIAEKKTWKRTLMMEAA